jgi:DNA-binding XRE family transcriptional regulator
MKKVQIHLTDEEYCHLEKMLTIAGYIALDLHEKIHTSNDIEPFIRSIIKEYIRTKRYLLVRPSDAPIKNRLDEILKIRRIKKADFSKLVGISSATLSLISSQKTEPTLDVSLRICDALGLYIYDVFYRE